MTTRQLRPCGTRAAYERHRKKGEPIGAACREANRIAQEARRALVAAVPGDVRVSHGLNGYDNYRCRCAVCRGAKSRRNTADRRKRLREAAANGGDGVR